MALIVLSMTMFFSLLFATVKALKTEERETRSSHATIGNKEMLSWPRR